MSTIPVTILLLLALALPIVGAVALRVLQPRMEPRRYLGIAALVFGLALASVLALSGSEISSVRLGGLTVLQPAEGPQVDTLPVPQPPALPIPTGEGTSIVPPPSPVQRRTATPVTPTAGLVTHTPAPATPTTAPRTATVTR
jgi:hypothetical protein